MQETIYTPEKIREILKSKYGVRYNSVLRDRSGMSGSWVSRHISGTLKTREGRKLIARALGVKLADIS